MQPIDNSNEILIDATLDTNNKLEDISQSNEVQVEGIMETNGELNELNRTADMILEKVAESKTALDISINGAEAVEITGPQGEKGEMPVKGKDYFTPQEVAEITQRIQKSIKVPQDGVTPIKGQDYFTNDEVEAIINQVASMIRPPRDGKDGEDAVLDYDYIVGELLSKMPSPKDGKDGKDGASDTPEQVKAKLLEAGLKYEDLKDAPIFKQTSKTTSLVELDDVDYSGLTVTNGKYVLASGGGAVDSVNGQTGVVVLDTGDVSSVLNSRYVTDAQLTVIGNTSGTNTGDNAVNSLYSGLAASKANIASPTFTGGVTITNTGGGNQAVFSDSSIADGNGLQIFSTVDPLNGGYAATWITPTLTNHQINFGSATYLPYAFRFTIGNRMDFNFSSGAAWNMYSSGSANWSFGAGAVPFWSANYGATGTLPTNLFQNVVSTAGITIGARAVASQTGDLFQAQDASAVSLFKITVGGNVEMPGSLGTTGTRLTKGWFTDLQVTNAIAGSITGNAATVTTNANLTGVVTSTGNATAIADAALSIGKTSGLQTALDAKAPLASPALTGDPTAPTPSTTDNDTSIATTAFVQANKIGYTLPMPSGVGFAITDASTTYWGSLNVGGTVGSTNFVVIPKTGTIKAIYATCLVRGTLGTTELGTLSVRLNDTTDIQVSASINLSTASSNYSATGLSQAVTAGDLLMCKFVAPTYATNPTSNAMTVSVYIE